MLRVRMGGDYLTSTLKLVNYQCGILSLTICRQKLAFYRVSKLLFPVLHDCVIYLKESEICNTDFI